MIRLDAMHNVAERQEVRFMLNGGDGQYDFWRNVSSAIYKAKMEAAKRFFNKSIGRNGKPGLVNIDKSGANKADINKYNQDNNRRIKIRQCKYLNNVIEQDHRRVKRITRSMLGFKNFHCAQNTLAGIELMAMINKGQMKNYYFSRQSSYLRRNNPFDLILLFANNLLRNIGILFKSERAPTHHI